MADFRTDISLKYFGNEADNKHIEFYDVGQALIGFQRSLAITTHLILNDKVIVQAPSLKKAKVYVLPPDEGSWAITAVVLGGIVTYNVLAAPRDTVLGHIVHSAYDYVISRSLGFNPDFDKTLGQQYGELRLTSKDIGIPDLTEGRFDGAIEKCETAIKDMHRPITKSQSATGAEIIHSYESEEKPLKHKLSQSTYDYMMQDTESDTPEEISGFISGYNLNTKTGRVFLPDMNRTVPFELSSEINDRLPFIESLLENERDSGRGILQLRAYPITSQNGRIKKYIILEILDD